MRLPHQPDPFEHLTNLTRVAAVLSQFGIVDAFDDLRTSDVTPERCMNHTADSLWFMGAGARKWQDQPWFRANLDRLHRRKGEVRFLVSDVDANFDRFRGLVEEFPETLQVRVAREPALFRLVIVDKATMVLAHYGSEVIYDNGENAQGWNSPQLLVDHTKEWSLMVPFVMLYKRLWDDAEPLVPVAPQSELDLPSRARREFR